MRIIDGPGVAFASATPDEVGELPCGDDHDRQDAPQGELFGSHFLIECKGVLCKIRQRSCGEMYKIRH